MPDKSLTNKNIISHMMDLFSNRHPLIRLEEQRQTLIAQGVALPNYLISLLESPYPSPKKTVIT